MELIIKRITNLLKIKSLVTLALTAVFCYSAVLGRVSTEQFLTIFTVVIAFYFGTQASRKEDVEGTVAKKETVAVETEKTI